MEQVRGGILPNSDSRNGKVRNQNPKGGAKQNVLGMK